MNGRSLRKVRQIAYSFDESYVKFMDEIGHQMFQEIVGHEKDGRKKVVNTRFGQLFIPKSHVLCRTPLGFKMTPYWQEQCAYMGPARGF